MPQVVIYPKQAATLTGHSYDATKRLFQRIRVKFDKPARSFISIGEFCSYTGLPQNEVAAALQ